MSISLDPNNFKAYNLQALSYIQRGKKEVEVELVSKAVALFEKGTHTSTLYI